MERSLGYMAALKSPIVRMTLVGYCVRSVVMYWYTCERMCVAPGEEGGQYTQIISMSGDRGRVAVA